MKTVTFRQNRAKERLIADVDLISVNEASAIRKGHLELNDETKVLKIIVNAGEEQEILSVQKNKDSRTGINDFQDGRIISPDGGGSFVVEEVKISHAAAVLGDDVATKSFIQTAFPSDLEHAVVQFSQNGRTIKEIKLCEFVFTGDAPQNVIASWKKLDMPFTIAAGKDLRMKLVRPSGITGSAAALSIEMQGIQTYPKRNKA